MSGSGASILPPNGRFREPERTTYPAIPRIAMRITIPAAAMRGDWEMALPAAAVCWFGGCERSEISEAPQFVQNFLSSSTGLPHWGQNCKENHLLDTRYCTGRGKKVIVTGLHFFLNGSDYFCIYQPVRVSSRIFSSVFFVRRLTTIMARIEMTNA